MLNDWIRIDHDQRDAPMIYVNSEGQLDFQVIQQFSITRPPSDHVRISAGRLGNRPFPKATVSIPGLNYRSFSGPKVSIYHISLENNLWRKPELR